MVTFILVAFSALILLSVLMTVGSVGKHRGPVTPGVAAGTVFIGLLELAALAYLYFQA